MEHCWGTLSRGCGTPAVWWQQHWPAGVQHYMARQGQAQSAPVSAILKGVEQLSAPVHGGQVLLRSALCAPLLPMSNTGLPPTGCTVCPCKHDTHARTHTQEAASKTPYKSLAAKVKEFQTKTPARFRQRAGPVPEHKPLGPTEPQVG
jgi:hypothetical protein